MFCDIQGTEQHEFYHFISKTHLVKAEGLGKALVMFYYILTKAVYNAHLWVSSFVLT